MKKITTSQNITKKESISIDKYFNEISREDLISTEQEIELAKAIKKGDKNAENKLVTSNLRFVVTVAKQYQNQGLSLDDLINEGNIGLITAARRFDETKGFKFISYAVWWIRQSIIQALSQYTKIVKLPINKIDLKNKVKKSKEKLKNELDREPSSAEIAEDIGEEIHTVENTLSLNNHQSYLNDSIKDDDESSTLIDVLENDNAEGVDNNLMSESLEKEILKSLKALTEREQIILKKFFGIGEEFPLSCDLIGKEFNLGSERIRQMKDKALRRLKIVSKDLKKYL